MAAESGSTEGVGETTWDDAKKEELQKLLSNVIHRRKTVPAKCMEIHREIVQCRIKQLQNAEVKLDDSDEKQKFLKMVNELKNTESVHLSLNNLYEAEDKVKKYEAKLKEINLYLKQRNQWGKT